MNSTAPHRLSGFAKAILVVLALFFVISVLQLVTRPKDPLAKLTGLQIIHESEMTTSAGYPHVVTERRLRTPAGRRTTIDAVDKALDSDQGWQHKWFVAAGSMPGIRYTREAAGKQWQIVVEQDTHDPKGSLITFTREPTEVERIRRSIDEWFGNLM